MPFFGLILLIVLVLFLVGAVPTWPHSRNWGYGPSGVLGLLVLVLLVLLLVGVVPHPWSPVVVVR
jgi:hypothetical protein